MRFQTLFPYTELPLGRHSRRISDFSRKNEQLQCRVASRSRSHQATARYNPTSTARSRKTNVWDVSGVSRMKKGLKGRSDLTWKVKTKKLIFIPSNSGRLPESKDLLTKNDVVKIKRCLYSLQRQGLPPVTTHNIVDDWNDPVLNS